MARTADQLVQQEVLANVSHLVGLLAEGCAMIVHGREQMRRICNLAEQAQELAAPIDDWEEAAIEAGWSRNDDGTWSHMGDSPGQEPPAPSAQAACEISDADPVDREVFEHWIVTDWLADKLEAKGEKVDRDFAGLTIWARTTTGQMVAMDAVIQEIAADLAREYPE